MKTFYSIVSATINPLTGDSISLGLLLFDGKNSRYSFSGDRLSFVKNLVSADQFRFIKDYLKSFDTIIENFDKNSGMQTELETLKENLVITEQYVGYMSIYGQNVVRVSAPVSIDLPVNEDNFQKLFVKFIDKQEKAHPKEKKSIIQLKDDFSETVKEHFAAEKELSVGEFPALELPVTVDLLGKNEQFVIVQFIDLERQVNFIKTDLYDLEHINKVIEKKKIFLVSQEPNKLDFPHQHYLWQHTYKEGKYDYTDLKDVERIQVYAKEHGVVPG